MKLCSLAVSSIPAAGSRSTQSSILPSSRPLLEKLQALQCHFTWDFEVKDKVDPVHILQKLAVEVEHAGPHNRGIYLATKAYLHHLQGCYKAALDSLQEAEQVLERDHPTDFPRQILVTYGNYAWVYYHLFNYEMVEVYLGRVRKICQSLSSPEPYSAQISEIHAQKGWSLLMMGFRNGEEAKKCFQMALRGDESNQEFQAGLAIAAFANWGHSWSDDDRKEAERLMENVVHRQSSDMEAKVYLADLLQKTDPCRSRALTKEVAENSLHPEVLRRAHQLCKPYSLARAIDILQRAIGLAPTYHILHFNLGTCYMRQLEEAPREERERILAAAIDSLKRAVEMDPQSVFSKLKLAQLYVEKAPFHAEELYQNLLEGLPEASKWCQQVIYLHWGDFLLQRKGLDHQALEMYMAGFVASDIQSLESLQLRKRLMNLARIFKKDSKMDQANAIYRVIAPGRRPFTCFGTPLGSGSKSFQ